VQLVVAIVQVEDADKLCRWLNAAGMRVTKIDTLGAFLAQRNTTLLVGVEENQIEGVLAAIRATCRTRLRYVNALPYGAETVLAGLAAPVIPMEVEVGGATVFCLPVPRVVRSQGRDDRAPSVTREGQTRPVSGSIQRRPEEDDRTGSQRMNLVVSIVRKEDADLVTGGLLAAGYRATRLNTAGAFLRRGNVTLIVGVEEDKLDDVLQIIQSNCRYREEPGLVAEGMPIYSATTFVLDVARVVRV
jgi:uncharacterized protein YaaQ